jgi:hypothetical protein
MKRMVLLILVLLLLLDLAEDGNLGKFTVYLPHPPAKISVTSSTIILILARASGIFGMCFSKDYLRLFRLSICREGWISA